MTTLSGEIVPPPPVTLNTTVAPGRRCARLVCYEYSDRIPDGVPGLTAFGAVQVVESFAAPSHETRTAIAGETAPKDDATSPLSLR